MQVGDVVQFNENHNWCGSFGIITEIKEIHNNNLSSEGINDIRFMIGIPIPMQGTAYIYILKSEFAIERIGETVLMSKEDIDNNVCS